MKTIIFSHGKDSSPNGTKIQLLSKIAHNKGFNTLSVDYRFTKKPDERVELLRSIVANKNNEAVILVGSSMGGYVSTVIAMEFKPMGLFLMCPALYMSSYKIQDFSVPIHNIMIVHGWQDTVIPYQNSIRFGLQHQAVVHLLNDNHRLSNCHEALGRQFEFFIQTTNNTIT